MIEKVLIKKLEEINDLLKASKRQLLEQLKSDPNSIEVADWLSQNTPRDDIQQWFIRNYKKNPEIWNDTNKETIKHYVGMADINSNHELGKIRFDKSHSFEDGINLWKQAEDKLKAESSKNKHLIEPDEGTEKKIDLGNGWGWHKLNRGYDKAEGDAMGHCGNINGQNELDDRIWSLRKERNIGGKTYHEPHLTFVENNGHIGESKGRNNTKPAGHYHDAIVELLKHPEIKENIGGGYLPNNNFYINDLSPEKREQLLKDKPSIERLFTQKAGKINPQDYPKKHTQEVENHNKGLDGLKSGKYNVESTLFRDADPVKAKSFISNEMKTSPDIEIEEENEGYIPPIMKSPHLDSSHIDEAFDHNHPMLDYLLSSHAANSGHIDRALGGDSARIREAAVRSPHFGPQHMEQALNDKEEWVRSAVIHSPHFGPQHMEQALNDEHEWVRSAAIESPHFGPQHVEQALNDNVGWIRSAAVQSPHFGPQHFDKAFNDKSWEVRRAAVESPHFGPQHMDKALNDDNEQVRSAVIHSPHFGPQHMEQALKDEDEDNRFNAIKSPHFGPQHIESALNNESRFVRLAAAKSPHFGPQHMEQALNDKYARVREAAAKSPHFGSQHFDKAFNDEDDVVRRVAVQSPHFGPQHFDKAFHDNSARVRSGAVESPHFGPQHMDEALNDGDDFIRLAATYSPHFGSQHFDKAFNDKNEIVRQAAVQSDHFGPQHMEQALNDKDGGVRETARKRQQEFKEKGLIKKLTEIDDLLKALGKLSSLTPSLRGGTVIKPPQIPAIKDSAPAVVKPSVPPIKVGAPTVAKPKAISNAAKNLKNPVKQAEQVGDANAKAFAMQQAKTQVKAQHNQLAFKSEDSKMFYAFRDGKRLHSEPMTQQSIHDRFGTDVDLKPVVMEKLTLSPNGQWTLE
jgi:hypothetical protein